MRFPILDLETTGLNHENGYILEVGVVLVEAPANGRLEAVDQRSWVVHYDRGLIMSVIGERAREMHERSGLLEEVQKSTSSILAVEQELCQYLGEELGPKDIVLCGNSIHFDRRWTDRHMPEVGKLLHYRMVDVSGIWEAYRLAFGIERPRGEPTHRAIADCLASLDLLRRALAYVDSYALTALRGT